MDTIRRERIRGIGCKFPEGVEFQSAMTDMNRAIRILLGFLLDEKRFIR